MASRAAARVTKNRFALPLDHRATRPGFQAPWGSIDPAQEVRQSSVLMGVLGGIFVSWGLFALTRRDNVRKLPESVKNKEWATVSEERLAKNRGA